jgi:hypothetical protein
MKFYAPFKISENMRETPEGYLLCLGVSIGRVGEMVYGEGESPIEVGEDGKAHVSRNAEELFRPETIASFEGKSFVITHPEGGDDEDGDDVNPENWAELTKGVLQNVRRGKDEQEGDLVADILITDNKAIRLVKNGLREVSCGYKAVYVPTGVGRGMQTNIVGNHLALVEAGRAGSSYAINDHKGKGSDMTLTDKIKAIFAKAQDEAIKVASAKDSANTETPETKSGFLSVDQFMGGLDAMFEKYMGKKEGDAATVQQDPQSGSPAKPVAKDAEEEEKKKKDARDAWIDAQMAKDAEEDVDDEEAEEVDDEEEVEDAVCDTASRVEILAPGMPAEGKNVKAKAILAAYATKDGKAVIDSLTGGKKPDTKNAKTVDTIFIAASELLRNTRRDDLVESRTRTRDDFMSVLSTPKGALSADDINKKNEEFYKRAN